MPQQQGQPQQPPQQQMPGQVMRPNLPGQGMPPSSMPGQPGGMNPRMPQQNNLPGQLHTGPGMNHEGSQGSNEFLRKQLEAPIVSGGPGMVRQLPTSGSSHLESLLKQGPPVAGEVDAAKMEEAKSLINKLPNESLHPNVNGGDPGGQNKTSAGPVAQVKEEQIKTEVKDEPMEVGDIKTEVKTEPVEPKEEPKTEPKEEAKPQVRGDSGVAIPGIITKDERTGKNKVTFTPIELRDALLPPLEKMWALEPEAVPFRTP